MFPIPSRPRENTATYAYLQPPSPLAFTVDECAQILERWGDDPRFEPSRIYGDIVDPERRTSEALGIQLGPSTVWMFERMRGAAVALNQRFWGLDLTGIWPWLQLLRYRPGQFQSWHRDGVAGAFSHRKLTLTAMMSDPADYAGGELQFLDASTALVPPLEHRARGTILAFPGWEVHQVTPVVRGTRFALVTFVEGPPLR
jgi:PKHD-type hydroxylase